MAIAYPELFTPIKIGSVEIKNRFMLAPMGPAGLCSEDGSYNQRGVEFYVSRAKGGTGLIMPGVAMVENEIEKAHMPSMPCPTINPGNFIRCARPMVERVHSYDAKIFQQLTAGFGRVGMPGMFGDVAIAPSEIPHRWAKGRTCRALTLHEIHTYVQKFADSAAICQAAGFDGVEIHAVHEGYLLDQFAIAFFNRRTDEYGGSLENRLRFACEIVQAIKERCGQNYPVSLRFSVKSFIKDWCKGAMPGEEFIEKGRDVEEGLAAAKILEAAGYDALNSDLGSYDSWYWSHPPMYQAKGLFLPYNEMLKNTVKIPIISAGRVENPELAINALNQGQTDMIGLGRPLLADADIPNKIMSNKVDQIRPCLSCHEGCMGRMEHFAILSCAVNPQACREQEYALTPALQAKSVQIVGGGVAGMEAARVAALRGHKVTLSEAGNQLGGVVIAGGMPDFKEDDHALIHWYEGQLKQLGVTVELNTRLTQQQVLERNADAIILATGSIPKKLLIQSEVPVHEAMEVLLGEAEPGQNMVVVGGGLVGCELSLWFKQKGHSVTLVEREDELLKLAGPSCDANHDMLLDLLTYNQIPVLTHHEVIQGEQGQVICKDRHNGEITTLTADSITSAIGYTPNQSLYQALRYERPEVYQIGDAREVSNIMYAIWDGFELARTI